MPVPACRRRRAGTWCARNPAQEPPFMRLALAAALLLAAPAFAADPAENTAETPAGKAAAAETAFPPLPDDKTIRQSAVIAGKAIAYDVTVGTIPVWNAKGKK